MAVGVSAVLLRANRDIALQQNQYAYRNVCVQLQESAKPPLSLGSRATRIFASCVELSVRSLRHS